MTDRATPPTSRGGHSASVSFEKFLEGGKSSFTAIDKRWNDALTRKNLGWAEGYSQGRFEVGVIHYLRTSGDSISKVFTRFCNYRVPIEGSSPSIPVGHGGTDEIDRYDQLSVFVGIVDLIECPNGRTKSLCRLNFVEDGFSDLDHSWIIERAANNTTEVLTVRGNREHDPFVVPDPFEKYGRYEMVKRVTQISDNVSDQQGNRNPKFIAHYFDNLFPFRSIRLLDSHPNVILDVKRKSTSERADVVRGPLGF